jgi:colicin import membrane protein
MRQFLRQYWTYLLGAVLLHVLFAGIFGLTLIRMSRNAPVPHLAIQAVVVDESMLAGVSAPPEPVVDRERERREAQQREQEVAEQRRQEDRRRQEEENQRLEAQQRTERERQVEQERREEEAQRRQVEERQLRERQEAERKREQEAERQRQAEAERKRAEEIKRKQQEEAERRKAEAEAKAQAAREEELRRQLADEEGVMQARSSSAMAQYVALIRQHVERRWIRPPSAGGDLECVVRVVQAPGGAVLSAQVTRCNGDSAVRQSIETAVMRSSPLPPPSDPRLFERTLELVFKPAD